MKKNLTTRIAVSVCTALTALSVGAISLTSAYAAPEPKEIVKDLTGYTVEKAIEMVPGGEVVHDLLKKGAGYILDLAFEDDGAGEEKPSIEDVLTELDQTNKKIEQCHKKEMDYLKLINANIDTQGFRQQADKVADDYKQAIRKMKQHSKNITTPGEGMIDKTTYRTYKKLLADPTCKVSVLEKNFFTMAGYINGEHYDNNRRPSYRDANDYLLKRTLADYKETKHDWAKSLDYAKVIESVNNELKTMHADAVMDYLTIPPSSTWNTR